MFKNVYLKYNYHLKTSPKLTNFITTGALFGIGDAAAQEIFPSVKKDPSIEHFDYLRTLRAVFYGSVIFSPVGNKWYYFLQTKIKWPGKTSNATLDTLSRVFIDQFVFAPISVPFYFGTMTILESGFNKDKIIEKIEKKSFSTLLSNWCIWPFIQLFNFKYIKIEHRLLTVNILSIFWNTFLSYKNNIIS